MLSGCQRPKNIINMFKETSARRNKDLKKSIPIWHKEQVFTVQKQVHFLSSEKPGIQVLRFQEKELTSIL